MKQFSKIAILFAVVAFVAASCGKYEEGPSFSLASKKGRLANVWKLEAKYDNGVEQTLSSEDKDSYVEFTKDGKMLVTWVTSGQSITVNGTWEFDDSKENIITQTTFIGTTEKDTLEILKLKSNEFWVVNTDGSDKSEMHYVTK